MPILHQVSWVPQALDSLLCPAHQLDVSIVANLGILSRIALIQSRTSQIISKDLGIHLKPREIIWAKNKEDGTYILYASGHYAGR
jgi:hypothetical protein